MNTKINELLTTVELRKILQDSLEYLGEIPPAGFSKKIYQIRAERFNVLTEEGSLINRLLDDVKDTKENSKLTNGEFIQSQLDKCKDDVFGKDALYLKEEHGSIKLLKEGLLEVMHVLIETNLNLGLIVDALVKELYESGDFREELSEFFSYNEAYFYSYAIESVAYILKDYFEDGVGGIALELKNEELKLAGKKPAKANGLAEVARASVGVSSCIEMFHILKVAYRMGDEQFIKRMNAMENEIKPYDNEEVIMTNFEENAEIETLPSLFTDYTDFCREKSVKMYSAILANYMVK